MDLQKEREAFLKWHYQAYLLENPEIDVKNAQYIYDYAHKNVLCAQLRESHFNVWQAAKAQAVPDGFVLVPKEPTSAMLFAASGRDIVAEHYGDENILWPELRETWKAMLEAQEPADD